MCIEGVANVNGFFSYRFRDDSNAKAPAYFSTEQLTHAGVAVIGRSDCQATLHYEHRETIVFCL